MEKAYTINDLKKAVDAQISLGNGNKRILVSADDEGNGYHELFYLFTPAEMVFDGSPYQPLTPFGMNKKDIKNYIILG
jgi:hypothetical protein